MANQTFSNKPPTPPSPKGGQTPPSKQPASGKGQDPQSVAEEQLKKILSQLADNNPANIAEIIHMWLNEDKK
jgi:flagellar biosynthesis/type III secretory pathway M-ring protein FliF/YscJ